MFEETIFIPCNKYYISNWKQWDYTLKPL